jgi:hypothetical protein
MTTRIVSTNGSGVPQKQYECTFTETHVYFRRKTLTVPSY